MTKTFQSKKISCILMAVFFAQLFVSCRTDAKLELSNVLMNGLISTKSADTEFQIQRWSEEAFNRRNPDILYLLSERDFSNKQDYPAFLDRSHIAYSKASPSNDTLCISGKMVSNKMNIEENIIIVGTGFPNKTLQEEIANTLDTPRYALNRLKTYDTIFKLQLQPSQNKIFQVFYFAIFENDVLNLISTRFLARNLVHENITDFLIQDYSSYSQNKASTQKVQMPSGRSFETWIKIQGLDEEHWIGSEMPYTSETTFLPEFMLRETDKVNRMGRSKISIWPEQALDKYSIEDILQIEYKGQLISFQSALTFFN